ncbi:MAG: sigma-70 family RNA polymerase sigma factor [Bacteroidota bacterium]
MAINDKELVMRLQLGDMEAFNSLYWKYHQSLYANINKLTKDIDATQDILQEVFITLWEKRLSIDVERPVSNWLFVVSYNKSIDYLKKVLKQPVSFDQITEMISQVEQEEPHLKEYHLIMLEKAIEQLSPQRKRVFELCKLQRKTYEEAAEELQISKHTVKEYLSAAVLSVKKYFEENSDHLTVMILSMFFLDN